MSAPYQNIFSPVFRRRRDCSAFFAGDDTGAATIEKSAEIG
jgi:hypothetical protein